MSLELSAEKLGGLKRKLQEAVEVCSPQLLLELVRTLEVVQRDRERLLSLLEQLETPARELLASALDGALGRNAKIDADRWHNLDTALRSIMHVRPMLDLGVSLKIG